MFKIIGADHKEYGPSTLDEIRQWITDGRADGRTLGKAEDTVDWKPLSAFPEFADLTAATGGARPSPASSAASVSPGTPAGYSLDQEPQFKIASCLSRASVLLKENFGLLTGATFLVWSIDLTLQMIPFAHLFLSGVVYGGLCLLYLKRIRGEPASIGWIFAGFTGAFTQLMLAGFVSSLLSFVASFFCLLPGIYLFVAWVFAVPLVADKRLEFWSAMEFSRKVTARAWFKVFGLMLVAFAPYILFKTYALAKTWLLMSGLMSSWMSAGGLPDFSKMMPAAVQVGRETFPLTFASEVVLLINLPLAMGALMYAYETLFGSRTAPAP